MIPLDISPNIEVKDISSLILELIPCIDHYYIGIIESHSGLLHKNGLYFFQRPSEIKLKALAVLFGEFRRYFEFREAK